MDSRPSVLLVLAATATTPEFRLFFLEQCRQRAIARLLFDQIHLFLSPLLINLLPAFNLREKLPDGLVPFVGTSPALAQDAVTNLVMHKLHFRLGGTQLVQDEQLLHPNVHYSAFELMGPADCGVEVAFFSLSKNKLLTVLVHIRHALSEFRAQDRAVIFCRSSEVAKKFADALPCLTYPAEANEDEKASLIKSWQAGEMNMLAIKSGLGVEFDYSNINLKLVIHYAAPQDFFTFLHESSKAGRNFEPAHVTTFWHPRAMPVSATDDLGVKEMGEYLRVTGRCRRISLLPNAKTCSEDGTAALCDNCQSLLAHAPIVSLWNQVLISNLETDDDALHDQQPIKESARILAMQCILSIGPGHTPPARAEVSGSEVVKHSPPDI